MLSGRLNATSEKSRTVERMACIDFAQLILHIPDTAVFLSADMGHMAVTPGTRPGFDR
jgi:hypothetical protein